MSEPESVLVVDDDAAIATVLAALLRQDGLSAEVASSGTQALERLAKRPFAAVITDLRMDGMDGFALLQQVTERWPEIPVVVVTAHATVPLAVDAMRRGAADFIQKPFDREEIVFVVRKVLAGAAAVQAQAPAAARSPGVIGESAALAEVMALVERAAPSLSTVLVLGETGTGKELIARALHERSPRRERPFVTLHCAALPEALLESELFGYERGAFTGATARKPGRVELAEGGTLFLDEIGELTAPVQVKLLRLLQNREFERLGGAKALKADVRFVAATHRELEAMVARGAFREDLFYRLNVVPIWLPPLRERREDIAALALHFCALHAGANGRPDTRLDPEALALLGIQPWPGNVRQLENFVERLVVLSDGPRLTVQDIERELERGRRGAGVRESAGGASSAAEPGKLEARRKDAEREALLAALARSGGNRTVAARILGVGRRTLYYKLEEHGLSEA